MLALMRGRFHLSIDDMRAVAPAVLRHRIILNFDAHADGQTTETILNKIMAGSVHRAAPARSKTRTDGRCNEPLLDSEFLEKLERLTLHWQKSFPGLGRRPQPVAIFRPRPGISRPSPFPSRRRSARRELARLHAARKALPENVPGRAAHAGPAHAGHQPIECSPGEAGKVRVRREACGRLGLRRAGRLDTITLQPFSGKLIDPFRCGGGRHRFQPASDFLARLKPGGSTNFVAAVRQFISEYPQRGLLVVISDFLDDQDCMHPLQYLADFGHELLLIHVWTEEDRRPTGEGEMELTDAETGQVLHLGLDDNSRREYTERFDNYAEEIRRLALRNAGRYVGLSTSLSIEECIFGSLVRAEGVV